MSGCKGEGISRGPGGLGLGGVRAGLQMGQPAGLSYLSRSKENKNKTEIRKKRKGG